MWEWPQDAMYAEKIRRQICRLDRETLEIIYAEWQAREGEDGLDEAEYDEARLYAIDHLDSDTLAEFIFERASEQALADNGCHEAWCCPFGCGPHTLPAEFSDEDKVMVYSTAIWGLDIGNYDEVNELTEDEVKTAFAVKCEQFEKDGWTGTPSKEMFYCDVVVCYTKDVDVRYVGYWHDLEDPEEFEVE